MRPTRLIVTVFVAAMALATVSCAASRFIGYTSKPDAPAPAGQFTHAALKQPVKVTYDAQHVPHIFAGNDHDLWFTLGYIQGRERLFQMDMLRRMAAGRVSELLGAQAAPEGMPFDDTLGMDRFFRVMGLAQDAERTVRRAPPESLAILEPYVAGVNAYIQSANPLPIEYRLIDETPMQWTVADALVVARLTSFQLSVNMAHELLRYLLSVELSPEAQREIFPSTPPVGPNIIEREDVDFRSMPRMEKPAQAALPAQVIDQAGLNLADWAPAARAFLATLADVQNSARPYLSPAASNSWAVSGSRTVSGKPILANDPHLLHTAPATFFLVHLNAPGIDAIGATLPGTPFLTLGRNQKVGWAATNTFADVQDLYLERLDPSDPTKYVTPQGPVAFEIEHHVLRERTARGKYVEHKFDLRYTRHGAVLNDSMIAGLPADSPPIAIKTSSVWPADESTSMRRFLDATSVNDVFKALETWGLPIQNWIAVDDAGHIGYFPMGLVPLRRTFDGTMPVPGWTDDFEWDGHIPFDQLPKMYDPPTGMIVTANNQVVPAQDYPYPYSIDTMQGYRAGRIRQMLNSKPKWTADEIRQMQTDAYAPQADRLLPALLAAVDGMKLTEREATALAALKSWDKVAGVDSVGATVFFATYREAWRLALDDDMPELFSKLVKVFAYTYGFFDRLWAEAPTAKVWDLKGTPQIEDRDEILRRAFKAGVGELTKKLGLNVGKWTWGKLHTITFRHPFGKSAQNAFDVGPFPIPGSWDTVWAAGYGFWDDGYMFEVSEGPAFRHVMDFASLKDSNMVLDLGQSGWPMTPQYKNSVDLWRTGNLWQLSMDPAVFGKGAEGTIDLIPAP